MRPSGSSTYECHIDAATLFPWPDPCKRSDRGSDPRCRNRWAQRRSTWRTARSTRTVKSNEDSCISNSDAFARVTKLSSMATWDQDSVGEYVDRERARSSRRTAMASRIGRSACAQTCRSESSPWRLGSVANHHSASFSASMTKSSEEASEEDPFMRLPLICGRRMRTFSRSPRRQKQGTLITT